MYSSDNQEYRHIGVKIIFKKLPKATLHEEYHNAKKLRSVGLPSLRYAGMHKFQPSYDAIHSVQEGRMEGHKRDGFKHAQVLLLKALQENKFLEGLVIERYDLPISEVVDKHDRTLFQKLKDMYAFFNITIVDTAIDVNVAFAFSF